MNKLLSSIIFLFSLSLILPAVGEAATVDEDILGLGLKVVVIRTENGEEPSCESVEAPEGSWGIGITNVNKVPGTLSIFAPDGTELYNSGEYLKKESGMTIKVRGNTSARYDKKPFKIKLEKKADLLLRGDKNLRDKNWVLLCDRNMLHNLGFLMGEWVEMPWAPAREFVNVIINDEYRGVYLLAEAVERNETCRIQTEESGFVTEFDPYWWNENGEYLPSSWSPHFNWTMKYPDFEDLTPAQMEYISAVLAEFESAIATTDYESMVDLDSFCRWLIAQDILGTSDGGGTNLYLAKNDDLPSSRLYIPLLWDVDSAEETSGRWSAVHHQKIINLLFGNSNPAFVFRYINLYKEISGDVFGNAEAFIKDLGDTDKWRPFNLSVSRNNDKWGDDNVYPTELDRMHLMEWFTERREWLDKAVAELEERYSSVDMIADDNSFPGAEDIKIEGDVLKINSATPVNVYSSDGRLIASGASSVALTARGIYILTSGPYSRKIVY